MLVHGSHHLANLNGSPSSKMSYRQGQPQFAWLSSKIVAIIAFFALLLTCIILAALSLMSLQNTARERKLGSLKFPFTLKELQELDATIMVLAEFNPWALFTFFSTLYIMKQSFSIPGSVILNLIAGRIYPTYVAFPLVCTLTMFGASSCYLLSKTLAKRILMVCCSERIKATGKSMDAHKGDLLWYMTFLRLIPMSPNWLINITAPIVGVPFGVFAASVFIGLMPYNFICVQAGAILSNIKSVNDIFTTWTMVKLGSLSVLAMVPIVVKRVLLRRQRTVPESILPR